MSSACYYLDRYYVHKSPTTPGDSKTSKTASSRPDIRQVHACEIYAHEVTPMKCMPIRRMPVRYTLMMVLPVER